jgi:hypothetical protein
MKKLVKYARNKKQRRKKDEKNHRSEHIPHGYFVRSIFFKQLERKKDQKLTVTAI